MGLLDDPKRLIVRMFEMEEREGRGAGIRYYSEGARPPGVPLDEGEFVFGVFKDTYFFTPSSLLTRCGDAFQRIRWRDITRCSSRHGEGMKVAELELLDRTTVSIRIGDFAVGWSGRISQLFHQMIEKFGSRATLGLPLSSVSEFFAIATDDYSIAPNLEPHPTLGQMREMIASLERNPGVLEVRLNVCDLDDGVPTVDGIVVRGAISEDELTKFAALVGADGVNVASDEVRRKLGAARETENVWHMVWD